MSRSQTPRSPCTRIGISTYRYESSAMPTASAICITSSGGPPNGTSVWARVSSITGQCHR